MKTRDTFRDRVGEFLFSLILIFIVFKFFFMDWFRWISPFGVEAMKRSGVYVEERTDLPRDVLIEEPGSHPR